MRRERGPRNCDCLHLHVVSPFRLAQSQPPCDLVKVYCEAPDTRPIGAARSLSPVQHTLSRRCGRAGESVRAHREGGSGDHAPASIGVTPRADARRRRPPGCMLTQRRRHDVEFQDRHCAEHYRRHCRNGLGCTPSSKAATRR